MPDAEKTVNFRLGEFREPIQSRAGTRLSYNDVVRRDLDRYYAILKQSLPSFAESEWSLLFDVLNGTMMDEHSARYLWAELTDAYDANPGLAAKWGVNVPLLIDKLRGLSDIEALAVVDAVERFWVRAGDEPVDETLEALGITGD